MTTPPLEARSLEKLYASALLRWPDDAAARDAYVERHLAASHHVDDTHYHIEPARRLALFAQVRREHGPRPPVPPPTQKPPGVPKRPGDVLAAALHALTGRAPCSRCLHRRAAMNERGWLWCLRNRRQIATWLQEAAKTLGYTVDARSSLSLLRTGWAEVRRHNRQLKKDATHARPPHQSPPRDR